MNALEPETQRPPRKAPISEIIVIILVLGTLVAIMVQSHLHEAWGLQSNACINELRQIDAAAMEFALEKHLTNGDPIHFPDDITPYIKLNSAGKIPACPSGGTYHLTYVGEKPTCSLSTTVTPAHVLP